MKTIVHPISRRKAIKAGAGAAAAFTIIPRHVLGGQGQTPPSGKLNIAGVGVGGMGSGDIRSVASENIVALCDVDEQALARNAKEFPKAKQYADFRKMLETQKDTDAVVEKLLWDGPNLRFTNSEAANQLINPAYRSGWSV
jgi:hypothetical protein